MTKVFDVIHPEKAFAALEPQTSGGSTLKNGAQALHELIR
jgi:hypothetical protein